MLNRRANGQAALTGRGDDRRRRGARRPRIFRRIMEQLMAGAHGGPTVDREGAPSEEHHTKASQVSGVRPRHQRALELDGCLEDSLVHDDAEGADAPDAGDARAQGLEHHEPGDTPLALPAEEVEEDLAQAEQDEAQHDLDARLERELEAEASGRRCRQNLLGEDVPGPLHEQEGDKEGNPGADQLVCVAPNLDVGALQEAEHQHREEQGTEQHACHRLPQLHLA
mmetsp:Transcript_36651/g.94905  ORF Transcript_36651/g.94905 Transcript_36651/m.94905 type:complete len:225 (-) Transcript_36651:407-1081(-)